MSKLLKKANIIWTFKNSHVLSSQKISSAVLSDLNIPKIIPKDFIILSRNRENITINIDLLYNKERSGKVFNHINKLENNIIRCYDDKFNNLYYDQITSNFEQDITNVLSKVERYYQYNKRHENDDFFIKTITIYFKRK